MQATRALPTLCQTASSSVDVLMTKPLKMMAIVEVQKLLQVTEDAWKKFPLTLQAKLAEQRAAAELRQDSVKFDDEAAVMKGCRSLAQSLCFNGAGDSFDALKPCYNDVINQLLVAIKDAANTGPASDDPGCSELDPLQSAMQEVNKKDERLNPELQHLRVVAEVSVLNSS